MSTARAIMIPFWKSIPFIIVCGCVIAMISFGARSTLGLFLAPMTEAREWSREVFALALALQNLLWGAGQPFAGAMADRYGAARVLALGGILYACGLMFMPYADTALWLNLAAGVLVGLGLSAASFSIVLSAFGRLVRPEQRSFAFGIGTAAGSLGQFLFAPLGISLINAYGWQNALLILSVMVMLIPLFAVILRGRNEDGSDQSHAITDQPSITQTLVAAFRHRSYILLVFGFFVCGFHVAFITVHLPPFLSDMGLAPQWAGWSIALIGLFNIFGSLLSGIIGGRYSKPLFLSLIYLARGVVIACFLALPVSVPSVLIFSAVMGLLWLSTVPPTSGLVVVMFGPRYMATLFGIVFFSHQVGAFLGVWLGGWLYDMTGSYNIVWYLAIMLSVFAALVHWPIQEKPAPQWRLQPSA